MTQCLQCRANEARGLEHRASRQEARQRWALSPSWAHSIELGGNNTGSLCISRNASTGFLRDEM